MDRIERVLLIDIISLNRLFDSLPEEASKTAQKVKDLIMTQGKLE